MGSEGRSGLAVTLPKDVAAGMVVFVVALPLCLGVALASDAPLFSGLLAGIIGGVVVGLLSGSHTSVSGPAAGLTAVVAAQIASLGSFEAFLLALVAAGVIQIVLGVARAGFLAAFFPSSVIKGLLAAIGVILILKQIPHLFGHDPDPEGDMAFLQTDHETTFSEFTRLAGHVHSGAAAVGLASLALLIVWERWKFLKKSPIPGPLVVVLVGVGLSLALARLGGRWTIGASHLVDVPVAGSLEEFRSFLTLPDWSQWRNPKIYVAALTIAAVASLETLLNLEAVDKLDPFQRNSPPSRELWAQGVGNLLGGLIGALPVTSVVIRSSVNVNSGGRTKLATILHGLLLAVSVLLFPQYLNRIPLSCLAAILLVTGFKLVSPPLIRRMWREGKNQFLPFAVTVVAIVLTDLLIGVLIGLAVSLSFILRSNFRRPLRQTVERHLGGEVVRIELGNQISFLNRAGLEKTLDALPRGGHVLLDARTTDYVDPDILSLIREFKEQTAPVRGVEVSLLGFRRTYGLQDHAAYVEHATQELQRSLSPEQVLERLKEGHVRFRSGRRLGRDLGREVYATAESQHPLAAILSCIDSRAPAELIFDAGVGDLFNVRVAGNVVSRKVLGSLEYACAVAGAKLLVVMGHTRCGAVSAAVDLGDRLGAAEDIEGCQHLRHIVEAVQEAIPTEDRRAKPSRLSGEERHAAIDAVARRNVTHVAETLRRQSRTLDELAAEGRILIVGAMYDVTTGEIEFLSDAAAPQGLMARV